MGVPFLGMYQTENLAFDHQHISQGKLALGSRHAVLKWRHIRHGAADHPGAHVDVEPRRQAAGAVVQRIALSIVRAGIRAGSARCASLVP